MKGKEDDDGRTKSANHLVGLSACVKLEQMPDQARFQSNLVREGGIFWSLLSYNFNYFVFVLSEAHSLVVLLLVCTFSHDLNEYEVE